MRADSFLAPWAKAKLYTSFGSASVWYECLRRSMACWQFYIAIHHSENDSFASWNSTRKLSNGNHCIFRASEACPFTLLRSCWMVYEFYLRPFQHAVSLEVANLNLGALLNWNNTINCVMTRFMIFSLFYICKSKDPFFKANDANNVSSTG